MTGKALESPAGRRPVDATVTARIMKGIQDGSLIDVRGRVPPERKLAKMFATTRSIIHEALVELCAQGLLQLCNRSRARVPLEVPDTFGRQLEAGGRVMLSELRGIEEFQEFRAFFECGLARHAARSATPLQLDRLRQAFLENRAALGQLKPFIDTDTRFHRVLAEIPGNPGFVALHTRLRDWIAEQRRLGLIVHDTDEHAFKGHREIMAAIGDRDPDAAERAMSRHVLNVTAHYRDARVLQRKRMSRR